MEKNQDIATVPLIVLESNQARHERTVKRLIIALIIAVLLIFASNALWLYAWSQYDYSSEEKTVSIDSNEGTANYIGNDGDIINGKDSGSYKDTEAP